MSFLDRFSTKLQRPRARRDAARPRPRAAGHPRPPRGARHADPPAVPGGHPHRRLRPRLLLGRRAPLLADARASTRPPSATPAAARRTRPTRRRAPGRTGHTEAVLVAYDPAKVSYEELLRVFWEGHDPTQGMRQGNDVGTQYRSAAYWDGEDQHARAARLARRATRRRSPRRAAARSRPRSPRSTAHPFYYAEDYHQQYLHKVPHGYCGLGGTGVSCPIGTGVASAPAAPAA